MVENMADNDDIAESANIPALFAKITALLEDAHEIAVRGQNSKLKRADYLKAADKIARELGRMRSLVDSIRLALPPAA